MRVLLRDAWENVRGIAGTVSRKLSWREALRILRSSLPAAVGERLVGVVILAVAVGAAAMALALVAELGRMAGKAP